MKRSQFLQRVGEVIAGFSLTPCIGTLSGKRVFNQSKDVDVHQEPLNISGIYPHLAVFNKGGEDLCSSAGGECGIGALVPWQGKLWLITYSPHCPKGSSDKLYSIDKDLNMTIQPESIGGTCANRIIHRETSQLIIGPYFIDEKQQIRTLPLHQMDARLTATARHLTDPANKVYFYGMEGKLFEVNVHTLEPNLLFKKPVPGWHGKGGYTAQGRLIIANNSQHKVYDYDTDLLQAGSLPKNKTDKGVLAEWNSKKWDIIERRQFTDITGPGDIYGAANERSPVWSQGWDKRSVILKLLDEGKWYTYRLPKATHTYDSPNGWYTEWPRIRAVSNSRWMMDMHGMFFEFPQSFRRVRSGGIRPVSSHLRIVPDFCGWKDEIVLASDDASKSSTPYLGQSQSNMWFGTWDKLASWGPVNGYGGLWMEDSVKAGQLSEPYLINSFDQKIVHLAHKEEHSVLFTFEIDKKGNNTWELYKKIMVPEEGYKYFIFPDSFDATWIRVKTDQDCKASVFFHYFTKSHDSTYSGELFQGLADIESEHNYVAGLVRPAGHNRSLQFLSWRDKHNKKETSYYEVDKKLQFRHSSNNREEEVARICALNKSFIIDEASVIVQDKSGTFRLPKTDSHYDRPFWFGWPRDRREVVTQRYLYNVHGSFYEIPRYAGMVKMRPITTHRKKIVDFCSWRGLLVMSGVNKEPIEDGHVFKNSNGDTGLWFGNVDDLWKLGKPVGKGGPWKNSVVRAGKPSLPYLMTGYDQKKVDLWSANDAIFTLKVDFDHNGWHTYKEIKVPAGKTISHAFPYGFSAHWIRLRSNLNTRATAWFTYT